MSQTKATIEKPLLFHYTAMVASFAGLAYAHYPDTFALFCITEALCVFTLISAALHLKRNPR